jgi:hypothetical protein
MPNKSEPDGAQSNHTVGYRKPPQGTRFSEIERQRLNPASRSEIIILFQALLNECVVTNPNVEVDDD